MSTSKQTQANKPSKISSELGSILTYQYIEGCLKVLFRFTSQVADKKTLPKEAQNEGFPS